ncbi:putative phophatidylserine decarboxylase [Lyophyllum shimeji]|uniref:Phophatidylserine decarboxylase n=1 Tax=Lyophyllum shimeji TaxID=47721 RepID=A0A9P3UTY9_LYOSH|nr:putative phophatidylserine decarboxylase [Lyophyllum shimeji]
MAPELIKHRLGGWLPQDHTVLERWLTKKIDQLESQTSPAEFVPVIKELQEFIEGDESMKYLFKQMFSQVPHKPPYSKDPTKKSQVRHTEPNPISQNVLTRSDLTQVRDYLTMLKLLNVFLTEAPEFGEECLVGFPISAILDWPMGTPAGFAAFYHPGVNVKFRNVLNEWAKFLSSPASCYVLTDGPGGWFSRAAREAMGDFDGDFISDPTKPHRGFSSWDDFFTRRFKPGRRPVPELHDPHIRVVISPCEATVYDVVSDVQAHDLFWLKARTYSLSDMLADHPYTPQFVGGTVYQAHLSATDYHRWHAPVDGTVVDLQVIPGTYFSESPAVGMDPCALKGSQGYLAEVATRALIFIQADSSLGLMCFMAVGMSEVSTCEITVEKGSKVARGDEIGMFHFGGSTSCLVFRPETKIHFSDSVKIGNKIKLNEAIGFVDDGQQSHSTHGHGQPPRPPFDHRVPGFPSHPRAPIFPFDSHGPSDPHAPELSSDHHGPRFPVEHEHAPFYHPGPFHR